MKNSDKSELQKVIMRLPEKYRKYLDCDFYSDRSGFKKYKVNKLNAYLRRLYDKYQILLKDNKGIGAEYSIMEKLYKIIVGFDVSTNDWDCSYKNQLREMDKQDSHKQAYNYKPEKDEAYFHLYNADAYFANMVVKHTNEIYRKNFTQSLKVYISIRDGQYSQMFIDAVKYLKESSKYDFHAKISANGRYESFIFWISAEDFLLLQNYMKQFKSRISMPLKLLPYYHGFGISKEFTDSYHALIALLIQKHFKGISSRNDVNVHEMFDCIFTIKSSVCPTLRDMAVLCATKNLILGKETFDKTNTDGTHLLLCDDTEIWQTLSLSSMSIHGRF